MASEAFLAVPAAGNAATGPASAVAPLRWSAAAAPAAAQAEAPAAFFSSLPLGTAAAVVGLLGLSSSQRRQRRRRQKAAATAVQPRVVRLAVAPQARPAGKVDCVCIVGCSGAVGQEMLKCLEESNFPTKQVKLFAKRSAGTVVKSAVFGDITVEPFTIEAAQQCEICLMAVSGDFSKEWAPKIRGGPKNTQVIDNSSAWRYDDAVPLVVPEINGDKRPLETLIANPNCTTAIAAMALWPLHQKYGLKKVIMSTYQAASGAGAEGMAELENGLKAWVKDGQVSPPEFFAHQLPFNVIPHIDAFQTNGYTKEEMKVSWELQKIFDLPSETTVSCTAVRVPTLRAHSESIVIETEKPVSPEEAREVLRQAPGVKVVDDPEAKKYPLPLNATGQADVEVGRIRNSITFGDHGLEFFLSGDQLLRGAALNAVLIAEQAVCNRLS